MKIIFIYFVLVTFYIDQVLGAVGFLSIKGISLFNLNIYLLFLLMAIPILQRRKVFLFNNANKYIVLMGLVLLMSIVIKILHGEIPHISIRSEIISFKQWLNPVLLFFIFYNIIDDKETCHKVLLGLSFLFVALISTQLSGTFGITGYKAATIDRHGRAGGFGAPGEYSIVLALFFPFVVSGIFFIKRRILLKIVCLNLGVLIPVSLINAGSRNGAVSFVFSMVTYFLILKRKKLVGMLPIIFLFLAVLGIGTIGFIVSPTNVQEAVNKKFDPSDTVDINEFTSGRIALLENGWKLFIDSPIFGHGRDSFMILSLLRGFQYYGAPHNEYLRHLVEHGLIGFIVFIMIFFKIFQNTRKSMDAVKDPSGNNMYMYISYIAGFLGFMAGMFATNTAPSLTIFWIYTAVIYKYALLDRDRKETSEVKSENATILYPV